MNITKHKKPEHKFKLVGENLKPSPSTRVAEINADVEKRRIESSEKLAYANVSINKLKEANDFEIECRKLSCQEKKVDYDFYRFLAKICFGLILLLCLMFVFFILICSGNFPLVVGILDSTMGQVTLFILPGGTLSYLGCKALLKLVKKRTEAEEKVRSQS